MNRLNNQILSNIFKHVDDTETYKSIRLTCKKWKNVLPTVKRFSNKKLKTQIFFEKNNIKMFNNRNELLKHLYFDNMGNSEYREYVNNSLIKTIKYKLPYNLSMVHNKGMLIVSRECDIREKKYINNYENVLPECITS